MHHKCTTADLLQRLSLSVLPVTAAALISAFFTRTGDLWYQTLQKPAFTPPQWAFPVAWGIVYVSLMAALYLIQTVKNFDPACLLLPIFSICGLNVAWSLVFFGLHLLLPAAFLLLLLLLVLELWLLSARPLHKAAAYLLLPHIAWGSFALVLNLGFFFLNR